VLLEREEPLALLERALARAREGRGHTFLVGGEAGIGKTTLLETFTAQLVGDVEERPERPRRGERLACTPERRLIPRILCYTELVCTDARPA
jgi:MoxR-like ATPase